MCTNRKVDKDDGWNVSQPGDNLDDTNMPPDLLSGTESENVNIHCQTPMELTMLRITYVVCLLF